MTQSPGKSNTCNQQKSPGVKLSSTSAIKALLQSQHSKIIYGYFLKKGSMDFAIIVTSEVLRFLLKNYIY